MKTGLNRCHMKAAGKMTDTNLISDTAGIEQADTVKNSEKIVKK